MSQVIAKDANVFFDNIAHSQSDSEYDAWFQSKVERSMDEIDNGLTISCEEVYRKMDKKIENIIESKSEKI